MRTGALPAKTAAEIKIERVVQSVRMKRQVWIWTSLVFCSMVTLAWLYGLSPRARDFERKIVWAHQFETRDKFKQDPKVDPRLRILMLDDSTVQIMKRSSLNFKEWSAFLGFIDRHRPSSIYIDKIFGLIDEDVGVLQDAMPNLRMLKAPVSIGSFSTPQQIPGRDELMRKALQFKARNYLPDSLADIPEQTLLEKVKESNLKDRSRAYVYGPIPQLQEIFRQGHIDYYLPNQVFPLYDLGGNSVLPSLAFSGRINLKIENQGITVGGAPVPRTTEGSVLVNWLSPTKAYSSALSFASAFDAMNRGGLWSKIPEGSHVLLMPLAFTGNVDFKESPYGQMPGGIVLASLINSALTKQWISEFSWSFELMILLVVLATLLQITKGIRSWIFLFSGTIFIYLVGMQQFVFSSTDFPWLAGQVFFGGTGTLMLSVRNIWDSRREKLMQKLEEDYAILEREERRLDKEIRDAIRVASVLKPEDVPDWPELEITAFHKSMSEASGDWYFFERSQSGRFAHFIMCDISGHGVQAALVVSGCKTVLSMMRLTQDCLFESPDFLSGYAERLNRVLFLNGGGKHTATMVGLTFDFESGKVFCVNCGHPFPVLHSASGSKIEAFTTRASDPIGFESEAHFQIHERLLRIGDCLITHSDGVPLTRARRVLEKYFAESKHGQLISGRRLCEALLKHFKKESVEIADDDISIVVFRRTDSAQQNQN
ncbi:MAG: PP2C family protein-serine/threonine phosphatase [Silvanigrellaceae bacterium]